VRNKGLTTICNEAIVVNGLWSLSQSTMTFCGAVGDTWTAPKLEPSKTSAIVPGTFSTQPSWPFVQKQPVVVSADPNAARWDHVQGKELRDQIVVRRTDSLLTFVG
jgi:hypothetical protein